MTVVGVVLVLGVVGLAGWAAATRTRGGEQTFGSPEEQRLASAWCYGLAVLTLGPAVLARIGILTPVAVIVLGSVVVVAALVALATRPATTRLSVGRLALPLVAVLALASPTIAGALARPDAVPFGTPWYFWYLTSQYRAEDAVPETSFEFGVETTALADYTGFSSGSAAVADLVHGPGGMAAATLFRVLAVVGALLGFWMLARCWGASRWAAFGGAALLAALGYYAAKLSSFRPEPFGYALMFLVPVFVAAYLRGRQWPMLVAAVVGVATLSQIHGVSFAVAMLLVAAVLATRVPAILRRHGGEARAVALVAIVLAGAWFATDLVLSARLTQAGKASALPPVRDDVGDPSIAFVRATRADPAASFPITARQIVDDVLGEGILGRRSEPVGRLYLLAVAYALGVAVVALVTRARGFPTYLAFAAVFGVLVLAVCLVFHYGWDTYVPRRTGFDRFLGLGLVLLPLTGSVAVGLLRRGRVAQVLVVAWVVLGVTATAVAAPELWERREFLPDRSSLEELRALDLPPDALVLTNAYSEGFVSAVLDADGLTDGRGPYHQEALLLRAIDELDRSRSFFADPMGDAVELCREVVTHVLVGTAPWMFGTRQLFPADRSALEARSDLVEISSGPSYVLYEVRCA